MTKKKTGPLRTILYIEDDPLSRLVVERTLKKAGYRVLLAENGLLGIDLARRELPDLIVTDINLPDLSGREITTTLRSEAAFSKTPIVAVTAQVKDEQRFMSLAAGVDGYLTKPLDMKTLPDELARYFNGARDSIDSETLAQAQTNYTQEVVGRLEERIRHLEAVNAELARLDRMKESFIQITAHELRTPLTVVYGYSRMIETLPAFQALLEGDDVARTAVGGLADSVRRMQNIINEIVVMSRIITKKVDLKIGPLTLGTVLEKALLTYQSAIVQRQLTIRYQPKDWATTIRGDVELMTLVFANLLSNAIKYTPDGGTITLSAETDGPMVRLSVKDTGVGIGDERATIFERFYAAGDTMLHSTSKTAFGGGGLGLGLALSKGVVEAHGGRIWVESAGHDPKTFPGSTFFVTLPLDAKTG